jgi:hypothetical protein
MDLVGLLLVSEDDHFTYLMMMVDRKTRWVEAVPLKGIAAASCMEAFMPSWVACNGVPETTHQTEAPSSLQLPGLPSAASWVCGMSIPQPITHRPTSSRRGYTGS